ncbi:MAG TPA: hypothetical protein VL574_17110, partial [Stellaceae bacterium]|nr:hypothetical protein [Stellaceae bacterium]
MDVAEHRTAVHIAAVLMPVTYRTVRGVKLVPLHHLGLFGTAFVPLVRDAGIIAETTQPWRHDRAFRWATAARAIGVL